MTGGTLAVEGEGDRGHTHCSGGRASGSAGCTGVPIPLSPSLGAPVPCSGRQTRVRGENTELEGQLGRLPGRAEEGAKGQVLLLSPPGDEGTELREGTLAGS